MGRLTKLVSHGPTRLPTEYPPNSFVIRKPVERGVPLPKSNLPEIHHGQHIYLYHQIQTNQVVYSLSRHLHNKDSLDQLPFLGKKTVPARLRKDLWSPLAMVYFPSAHAGLEAYRQLREFRKLHETSYPLDIITEKEGKHAGTLYPTKKRGRVLMDQKANSVADLAAVLLIQEKGPKRAKVEIAERKMKRVEKKRMMHGKNSIKTTPVDVAKEMAGVEGVMVRWANLLDAEYAETWPEAVVHDDLKKSRHTAAFPVMDTTMEEGVPQEMVGARWKEHQAQKAEQQKAEEEKGRSGWLASITSVLPWRTRTAAVAPA